MCGIAGIFRPDGASFSDTHDAIQAMTVSLANRGPDDSGVWIDNTAVIALGHRRLSVVELTTTGRQPMESNGSRFVISYNGEVYNHLKLRKALALEHAPVSWRGNSDTETLLAGFEQWGIEDTVKQAIGMFAFAVWDKKTQKLTICTDRTGEKPLYYGWQGNTFLFGSDLLALKAHPAFRANIDRCAIALLMRHNCIPAPYSIYQGIQKLPPGTLLTVSRGARNPETLQYWDAREAISRGLASPFAASPADAVSQLDSLLKDAVAQQMLSDVPIGAFLSGGVDSSTIVALMQAQSSNRIRTFTIGFDVPGYNEAEYAKSVSQHLGTDHTEMYITAQQAMDVIPELPNIYSEPFADSSQIPTYLLSRLARESVTVALSGDGADELFCGYSRYAVANGLFNQLSYVPVSLRGAFAKAIGSPALNMLAKAISAVQVGVPKTLNIANIEHRLHKLSAMIGASSSSEFYRLLISHWSPASDLVLDALEPTTVLNTPSRQPHTDSFIHQMMALDLLGYLPDDILVKIDRAAMAVGLETRVPFLDHRVVEFAWQLPLGYKNLGGVNKWPLRQVLRQYVPDKLIDRPKMGFGVPIDVWLRGPLRAWAEDLLSESRLVKEGFFNPKSVRKKWEEHLSLQRNWQSHLWDVLMFQAWLAKQ